jgi:hypothetical protein
MRICHLIRLAVAVTAAALATAAWAATADDYKAALAKADAAVKQAHALKNEWTTTGAALKAAKAAADAGKFGDAVKHAQEAEALANGSIAQAKEQEKLWPEAIIR